MNLSVYDMLVQLAMIIVPTTAIALLVYFILKSFLEKEKQMKLMEVKTTMNKETRLLKLQAYERMAVFLERISPEAVISRVYESDMLSQELQLAMISTIRAEYEHNISQQIYISSNAWSLISSAKDELIKTIGLIGQRLSPEMNAQQFSRIFIESISSTGQPLPNLTALEFLKAEAREIL